MSPSTETHENREFAAELKFLIPRELAEPIRDWVRPRLPADPHASTESNDGYQITSLYFDTDQFDVFHRRGSFRRSKYRIRRYGVSDVVFLERKLKTRGLVSKRRTVMALGELAHLAESQPDRGWAGGWFHRRLLWRKLKTVCQISYRRTARVLATPCGPIRLTIDVDLRTRNENGLGFTAPEDGELFLENHAIVEMKYLREIPTVFKLLAEEFELTQQPLSKYRLAAPALGLVPDPEGAPSENGRIESSVCLNP